MGLVELGRHTGLSASFLSQLETGRVVPTLRNLARVAMVFSKDLSYFFEPEPQSLFRVHRRKERVRLPQTGVDDPTYFFESLGYMVPDRPMPADVRAAWVAYRAALRALPKLPDAAAMVKAWPARPDKIDPIQNLRQRLPAEE